MKKLYNKTLHMQCFIVKFVAEFIKNITRIVT
ncbi:hypothetical protein SAMN05428947_101259 [Mucilaginibacter sp. OK283]|jgi:hypothetical protein|nr:hypothetical protein SAMN05428947_101259 [Mucilaginibacter sp. OK283]